MKHFSESSKCGRLVCLSLLGVILSGGAALAQSPYPQNNPIYAGLALSHMESESDKPVKRDMDADGYELTLGYRITPNLSGELQWADLQYDGFTAAGGVTVYGTDTQLVKVSALYYPDAVHVRPFGRVGYVSEDTDTIVSRPENKAAAFGESDGFFVGLGIDIPVVPRAYFRAEYQVFDDNSGTGFGLGAVFHF
ncbi:MAG: outer membrane beta-barrel protein [Parvibaculales bacterium]